MEQAKAAVKGILSRHGKNDTTVHEHMQPAVTHDTVTTEQREERTAAIDKEIHQDHYHTSVQPIKDEGVLPEQHHHQTAPVQHREFDHRDDGAVKRQLAEEASKFQDQHHRVEGAETSSVAQTEAGQHVHHHIHETIQPVIDRQVIEPHVTHTTVPVHEVHHNAAQHHTASTLPAVSMKEFQQSGGNLGGRGERTDGFTGEPRAIGQLPDTTGRHSNERSGNANV